MSVANSQTKLELVQNALDSGTLITAQRMLQALHPAEIGDILESLPQEQRLLVWELVDLDSEGGRPTRS